MTQRALATRLGVTPRNVTGRLDALEADGLVRHEAHPSNRRALLVSLTLQGQSLTTALRSGRNYMAAELFEGMSNGEVAAFTASLQLLIERLRPAATAYC